jgi:hypothetical protein
MNTSIKTYVLTGAGTEIANFNVTDSYEKYLITGSAIAIGSYNISIVGTPQVGTTFILEYAGILNLGVNTFTILGTSVTQAQLLKNWIAECTYNGTSWDVVIQMSFAQSDIISSSNIGSGTIVNSNIQNGTIDLGVKGVALSLDTAKIANLAVTTAKIDNLAVTDAKINDVNGSKLVAASVTNAKLATMADQTVKANVSGGVASPSDVSITTLLNGKAWGLQGNSGTTPGTDFVGTTDANDLVFKTNNVESGRINLALLNTSYGYNSLVGVTIGTSNVAIGYQAGQNVSTGGDNTIVGKNAGSVVTTGSKNTLIGTNANVGDSFAVNRIALGVNANATQDDQFAIPDSVTTIKFKGIVYTLPTANGTGTLNNDGAGVLSWKNQLDYGTYTPTLTDVTNVAVSVAYTCQWMRVGDTVTVSGKVEIDPTAGAGTATELGISLPVASNFASAEQCAGTAVCPTISQIPAAILADAVNNRASLQYLSSHTTSEPFYFSFTYKVI